jgi:hypothetical protein
MEHFDILRYFLYDHLPGKLQVVSKPFGDLAAVVAANAKDFKEAEVALRKLLEAKDAAVRSVL